MTPLLAMHKRLATIHAGRRIEIEPTGGWTGTTCGCPSTATSSPTPRAAAGASSCGATPPPGTRPARREAFARHHRAIGTALHPAAGVAKVLLALVGLSFLLRLIPVISIDLPLPSLQLPALPDWLRVIVDSAKYWSPIVPGLGCGAAEYRRRSRQRATNDARRASARVAVAPRCTHRAFPFLIAI
jgi:hypothetical protein